MPGWFDLRSLELADSTHDDEPGLLTAVDLVDDLIQDEIDTGTPENKIVLGGISQGGAIAILHCITKGRPLAGVVALSTWITLGPRIAEVSYGVIGRLNR
jgi:predicted esterase